MRLHRHFVLTAIFTFATILPASLLAAPPESANALLAQAKARAAAEHKNLLLVFSASWCGPCHLYERFLEDPEMKPIVERAFVVQRFDVGERAGDERHADTPGAVALRASLGAVGDPGYPFIVIADQNGQPLVNSYRKGKTNGNVGYPAAPEEIDWYIEMLKRAAPALTPGDLAATRKWLQQHAPR